MTNQTVKKDPHNKGRLTLLERSRSIWQGSVFLNRTFTDESFPSNQEITDIEEMLGSEEVNDV